MKPKSILVPVSRIRIDGGTQTRAEIQAGVVEDYAAMGGPIGQMHRDHPCACNDYLYSGMQVIVGFNSVRHELNARIRTRMGYKGRPASPGEKLICLQNNARFNVFNGQQLFVTGVCGERLGVIELEMQTDDGRRITAPCLSRQFGVDSIRDHRDPSVLLMDYAYALTAHKAQGSEYDSVLVIERISGHFDANRWRYTATTRARDRLVYCW